MKVKWQSNAPKMELKVPSEVKIDGGYIPTAQDLAFTGNQAKELFSGGKLSWILEHYTSLLSFSNIQNADSCFYSLKSDADLTNLTFYMKDDYSNSVDYMFQNSNLTYLPHIVGKIHDCSNIFKNCKMKLIPDNFFDDFIFQKPSGYSSAITCSSMFQGCSKLTKVPSLKAFKQLESAVIPTPSYYSNFYYYLFDSCVSLQEIRDLPIIYDINSEVKQNFFQGIVDFTGKLSSFTFEPNQTARLSNQLLSLVSAGYTYYGGRPENSVYNHDSAVETINSLPDTSAFLAEVGGTNTIKFRSNQGANTEGGAIGDLTAEEIAVAAAKGWTVAFR